RRRGSVARGSRAAEATGPGDRAARTRGPQRQRDRADPRMQREHGADASRAGATNARAATRRRRGGAMTTLDERMRAAADAIGDAPRHAPPFGSLHRSRRRRQRASAVVAAVLSIAVVCAVALVAARGDSHATRPAGDTSTPTSAAVSTTGTTP